MKKLVTTLYVVFALAAGTAAAGKPTTPPLKGATALPAPSAPAPAAVAATHERGGATREPVGKGRGHTQLRGVVNLNQADEATLELLPGIGPAKSKAIVDARAKRPFKRVDDFTRVKGIGKKTLQRLRPFLVVLGTSTLVEEPEPSRDTE